MLKKFLYTLWISIFTIFVLICINNGSFSDFITSVENRTFDIRQSIASNSATKTPNKDIVIVSIDDASYEYILDNYGEWPLSRKLYAKMVDYIEAYNPNSIAFDLMFVKSMKSDASSDKALVEIFKKYNNVFTAMNLDNQPEDLRIATTLPEKLSIDITGSEKLEPLEYSNCRVILNEIIDATSNIGMINVSRSEDGVLRKMPVFLKYKDKFYPQLAVKVAQKYLNTNNNTEFIIHKNNKIIFDEKYSMPIDNEGSVVLNWYGASGTFENIPMYKLLKAVDGKEKLDYDFTNKIVYFGATASSLFDIKTIPVSKVFPGVEVQTTYVNNIIDGNLIKQTPACINIMIGVFLGILTVLLVIKLLSLPLALGVALTIYSTYIIFTYYLMLFYNLWLEIITPLIIAFSTFIITVIIKYLIKSRDFDQQYKLATTDGLTELYNHRYFQENLKMQIEHAKRYEQVFSLIFIDIDHFKQFNDIFGHQSGDAVLRQVAFELKKNVRSADIVCRYGGEEMSIILPNTKYEEAYKIAEKLCKIIASKNFKLNNNKESQVTISLGVSTYKKDGITPTEIIETADKRLYNAKNNGRNRVN